MLRWVIIFSSQNYHSHEYDVLNQIHPISNPKWFFRLSNTSLAAEPEIVVIRRHPFHLCLGAMELEPPRFFLLLLRHR